MALRPGGREGIGRVSPAGLRLSAGWLRLVVIQPLRNRGKDELAIKIVPQHMVRFRELEEDFVGAADLIKPCADLGGFDVDVPAGGQHQAWRGHFAGTRGHALHQTPNAIENPETESRHVMGALALQF